MSGTNALLAPQTGANALTVPQGGTGIRAYHGSSHDFDRFDAAKLHPDEAGHYFALDEKHAADYADPHMYEVNIRADLRHFLDYGALTPTQQEALNQREEVQRLRDAGVPGIKFPDRTLTVFAHTPIDIIRKYHRTDRVRRTA